MKKILSPLILLLLLACNHGGSSSGKETSQAPLQDETVVSEFMNLVNAHRKSIGFPGLVHSSEMALIALHHSEDMADKEVAFGHTGFSSRCSEARDALNGGNLCAENVAMGQETAQAVFTAWMNSPSHRANIENSRVTHSGLGFTKSSDGTIYWTHLFLEL